MEETNNSADEKTNITVEEVPSVVSPATETNANDSVGEAAVGSNGGVDEPPPTATEEADDDDDNGSTTDSITNENNDTNNEEAILTPEVNVDSTNDDKNDEEKQEDTVARPTTTVKEENDPSEAPPNLDNGTEEKDVSDIPKNASDDENDDGNDIEEGANDDNEQNDDKNKAQQQQQDVTVTENVEKDPSDIEQPLLEDDAVANKGVKVTRHLSRKASSVMENAVLRFNDVNFVVGSGDKTKNIITNVSGKVRFGHVLAIMGPSGAGKTTLINALTLSALYGTATGSVTLNGDSLTDQIFKEHCYVVVQHDKHWPLLTCRETLRYAAELYDAAEKKDIDLFVDQTIAKMGLETCADTKNARLSGGQWRRLSLGLALLKQPTVLFLDEPTSGLDSAAAENIMKEIVRVAKEEKLIIVCTIHQPSTKVYNGFDQVMILSKGRLAYSGDATKAPEYFEAIGHPVPPQTNPAEHMLDLVNSDFSDEGVVTEILDAWGGEISQHGKKVPFGGDVLKNPIPNGPQNGTTEVNKLPLGSEIAIMFRRHGSIIVRDPILYLGRCVAFLVMNIFFSLVYYRGREYDQIKALDKLWVNGWFIGVPSNMAVVAVYQLNDEFKTVLRETKNGMVRPMSYLLAKSILVLPIMLLFAIFSLGVPAFVIMDLPGDSFAYAIFLYAAAIYVYECVAECLAIWIDDPIIGMLGLMNYWFAAFLFCGLMIPIDNLYWPFKLFYYITPLSYYLRAQLYNMLEGATFSECDPATNTASPICVAPPTGINVLGAMHNVNSVVDNKDTYAQDVFILLAMAVFFKLLYVLGVYIKTNKVSSFQQST